MNQSKPYGRERSPDSRRAGGTPGVHHSPQHVVKSLARLAAEEAFTQLPSSSPTCAPAERQYTGWRGEEPAKRIVVSPSIPSLDARQPRVFRLTTPEAAPQVAAAELASTAVGARVKRTSPDTRPGPVSIVYVRPVTAELESPAAASLPELADAAEAPKSPFRADTESYAQVMAKLAELDDVIAAIHVARAFTFDVRET